MIRNTVDKAMFVYHLCSTRRNIQVWPVRRSASGPRVVWSWSWTADAEKLNRLSWVWSEHILEQLDEAAGYVLQKRRLAVRYLKLALLALLLPSLATADIYRWIDANGIKNYAMTAPDGVEFELIKTLPKKTAVAVSSGSNTPEQIHAFLEKLKRLKHDKGAGAAAEAAESNPAAQTQDGSKERSAGHGPRKEVKSITEQREDYRSDKALNKYGNRRSAVERARETRRNKPARLSKKQANRAARQ
mgnify:FL=1